MAEEQGNIEEQVQNGEEEVKEVEKKKEEADKEEEGGKSEEKEEEKAEEKAEEKEEKEEEKAEEKEEKEDKEEEKKDEEKEEQIPEPDKAVLKEQFILFSKFGDKAADGKSIKLSQSDKWFKQAQVIDGKTISTTDTGIAFRKVAKNAPKLSYVGWNKYLEEIANSKGIHVNTVKNKLVDCGKPGLSGATSVAKNAAVDRLTDTSKYGGTHKQRFDSTGKGKGKDGRVEPKSDGYVSGFKKDR